MDIAVALDLRSAATDVVFLATPKWATLHQIEQAGCICTDIAQIAAAEQVWHLQHLQLWLVCPARVSHYLQERTLLCFCAYGQNLDSARFAGACCLHNRTACLRPRIILILSMALQVVRQI